MIAGNLKMEKVNKNILIDICLDEIDVAKDKLKSTKNDNEKRLLFEGWIRKQKQTLKKNGYRRKNEKS